MLSTLRFISTFFVLLFPAATFAASPAPSASPFGSGSIGQLIFFGGFILIFYFLMWRPQSKRAKDHRELLSALNKGDEVMINGGLLGKITRVKDDYVSIEIAQGVEAKVQKAAVSAALPKGTLKDI